MKCCPPADPSRCNQHSRLNESPADPGLYVSIWVLVPCSRATAVLFLVSWYLPLYKLSNIIDITCCFSFLCELLLLLALWPRPWPRQYTALEVILRNFPKVLRSSTPQNTQTHIGRHTLSVYRQWHQVLIMEFQRQPSCMRLQRKHDLSGEQVHGHSEQSICALITGAPFDTDFILSTVTMLEHANI